MKNVNNREAEILDKKLLKVYLVTDNKALKGRDFFDVVEDALKGGVTIVQLREKELNDEEFIAKAIKLKKLTKKYNVPLIINDNISVAKAVDADGVHIGQKDLAKYGGVPSLEGKIIGITANTPELAIAAEKAGADYIGAGALFATSTKGDAKNISYDTLKAITEAVNIPVVAIGGINTENAPSLKGSGIAGCAVSSGIMGSESPEKAAETFKKIEY